MSDEAAIVHQRPRLGVPPIRQGRASLETLSGPELSMILVSLGLLFLSCSEISPLREFAVIGWLVSLMLVGLSNTGAALGLYASALALYSNHHGGGSFLIFERPDHPALLIILFELGLLRMKDRRWFSLDAVTLVIGAFVGYSILIAFLTGTLSQASITVFLRGLGIPFLLAVLVLRSRPTRKDIRSFLMVLFLVAGYSAIISVLWVSDLRHLMYPSWIQDPDITHWAKGQRAGGIFVHPGYNGVLLSMVFCMVYLAYRRWIIEHGRIVLIILGTLLLCGIFVTYARSVYIGVIPALGVLFWQRSKDARRTGLKRTVVVASAVLALTVSLLAAPPLLRSRIGNEATVAWRFEIWEIGLKMVQDRPLLGYGIHGFGRNAASFLEDSERFTRSGFETTNTSVHNTFFNVIIAYGLLGFLLYGIGLYLLFKRAVVSSRMLWGKDGPPFVAAFAMVYLIPGQFMVLQDPAINLIFLCTPALLAGMVRRPQTAIRISVR